MKNFLSRKTGFILFGVICATLVLILIITPLISWTANEFSWTNRSFNSLRALNLADGGAELAVWEIIHNDALFTGWGGVNPKTLTISSFTDNFGETIGDITLNARSSAPNHYLITSTGYIPGVADYQVKKIVKVKVFPRALFNNGIFGYSTVTLTGNTLVDSFDSADGPYSLLTAGSDGDVGTNGAMTLLENAVINGDVFIGSSGTIAGDTSDNLSGEIFYSADEVELEGLPPIDNFILLPSLGNYTLSGNSSDVILPGDYRYESMIVDGQAILTISSNTRIYIHNDITIAGQAKIVTNDDVEFYIGGNGDFAGQGIVNTSGVASNLQIFGMNEGTNMSFTGLNDFYGTFFAPKSSIYMAGDANYYGAVVGKDVVLAGNIQFHYDEELTQSGPFLGYDIAYWQED